MSPIYKGKHVSLITTTTNQISRFSFQVCFINCYSFQTQRLIKSQLPGGLVRTGFDFCIKCNGGGEVLVCKGDDCPVVLHKDCVGSPAVFDDVGKFECPYCLSRKAYVELNQLRESFTLRKRELAAFMGAEVNDCDRERGKFLLGGTGNVETFDGLDRENHLRIDGPSATKQVDGDEEEGDEGVAGNREDGKLSGSDSVQEKVSEAEKYGLKALEEKENRENNLKALEENENRDNNHDKIASSNENDSLLEEEAHTKRIKVSAPYEPPSSDADCSGRSSPIMGKSPRKRKKTIAACEVSRPGEPSSSNVDCSRQSSPRIPTSPRKRNKTIATCEVSHLGEPSSSNIDCSRQASPRIPVSSRKTKQAIARSKVNIPSKPQSSDVDGSGSSLPIIRKSPRKAKETNIATKLSQNIGRKKAFWTVEEEAMIKKGVEKYSEDDKNIPWRIILDFGRDVFHSSRNPQNLKDKWRTMNLAK